MRTWVRKLLKPKILLPIGLLAGIGAAASWWYRYNQTPVMGVVHAPVAPQSQVKVASAAHFKSEFIAFDYPTQYATVENKSAGAALPIVEQYSLGKHNTEGSGRISITVKKLPGSSMLEDSAYTFRKLKAGEYETSDVSVGTRTIKKMAKKDGSEIIYFFPGDKAYAMITGTTSTPKDNFADEVSKLVHSFVWVQ